MRSRAGKRMPVTLSPQYSGGDIDAAALPRDADPDALEFGLRLGRKAEFAR
jgi:hypothetical protein